MVGSKSTAIERLYPSRPASTTLESRPQIFMCGGAITGPSLSKSENERRTRDPSACNNYFLPSKKRESIAFNVGNVF